VKINLLLASIALLFSFGCKKADTTTIIYSKVSYVDAKANTLTKGISVPLEDTTIQINLRQCDLYLSNFKLVRQDGTVWKEANSYHLIRLPDSGASNPTLTIKDFPSGTYAYFEYSFGVDSASNLSLDHRGDLDPTNGMAWDWNTGYRFLVMEGTYKKAGVSKNFLWHIGTNKNYRTLRVPLQATNLQSGNQLTFKVNVQKFFTGTHTLPVTAYNNLMFDVTETALAADNLVHAIEIEQR
jgi:hypothetical protein